MKTLLFAATLMLFSPGSLFAQSKPGAAAAPKGGAAPASDFDADGNITLPQGTLREVVDYLEKLSPGWPDHTGNMPNIAITTEAAGRELPGPLTLHHASPLQAVAFAAAAADCTLEAVMGPPEASDPARPPAIIGYRITLNKTPKPGSGTVSLTHAEEAPTTTVQAKQQADPRQKVVRVYSLGPPWPAEGQNPVEFGRTREERNLIELVHSALEKSEPPLPEPDLTVHMESRALVVKGTPAQQEIVEQVLKVLKENRQGEARPATSNKP